MFVDIITESDYDLTECEDRFLYHSGAVLPADYQDRLQCKASELDYELRWLQKFGLEKSLLVIRRANSIVAYFVCKTSSAVMGLRDRWRSGDVRYRVESLFKFLKLLVSGDYVMYPIKRLTWRLADYERCLESFSSLQGKPTIYTVSKKTDPCDMCK